MFTGGHDNRSSSALSSGFKYDVSKATWSSSEVPEMNDARKDHACLYIELETTKGILVTGGKLIIIKKIFQDILITNTHSKICIFLYFPIIND